jgi:hypothetical protein
MGKKLQMPSRGLDRRMLLGSSVPCAEAVLT